MKGVKAVKTELKILEFFFEMSFFSTLGEIFDFWYLKSFGLSYNSRMRVAKGFFFLVDVAGMTFLVSRGPSFKFRKNPPDNHS